MLWKPPLVLGIGALLGYLSAAGDPHASLKARTLTPVQETTGTDTTNNDDGAACSSGASSRQRLLALAEPRAGAAALQDTKTAKKPNIVLHRVRRHGLRRPRAVRRRRRPRHAHAQHRPLGEAKA